MSFVWSYSSYPGPFRDDVKAGVARTPVTSRARSDVKEPPPAPRTGPHPQHTNGSYSFMDILSFYSLSGLGMLKYLNMHRIFWINL